MSITHRPRKLGALSLALALVAGVLFVGPASAAETSRAATVATPAPWWVDWLEVFDLNHNKIDDEVERKASAFITAGQPTKTVPVLLTFERSVPTKNHLVDLLGAENVFLFETQPVADLDVPARNVHLLSTIPGLAAVEYDMVVKPALDVSSPATQANRGEGANTFYNGRTAEDLGYTGEDTVVAVLDTGVQDVHEAFAGKWIAGAYVAAPVSVNCVNPPDGDGHGSHVASTVLGQLGPDGNGTAKSAKLVEIKISVDAGATSATIGGIARGFEFVKRYNDALAAGNPLCGPNDDHIDVATLSFGSTGRGGPNAGTDEAFIDALVRSGVAVTIAVGNCGPQASSTCSFTDSDNGISSPGNAAGAIGVASFDDRATVDRANDIISGFSSRGPNSGSGDTTAGGATSAANLQDRHRKPEIAAPGTGITAAGPAPFLLNTLSGTSMATPHVAGIAALLIEAGERAKDETGGSNLMMSTGNGYSPTGAYVSGAYPVRDAIVHSADYKVTGAEGKWTGPNAQGTMWNNAWGYGQVNAFGAVCWAWQNVLLPGGATPPAPVADNCELTGADPLLTITDPEDGATVPSGVVDISGVANRDGGTVTQLSAALSGPDQVANGTAASYSVVASDAAGDVTCTITAAGAPTRSNEAADGCSVDLTWASDGTFAVTGEATDGTNTASDTIDVSVRTAGGIPEPDGTLDGGITIFGANPLLAHNEVVSLVTGPVDPAPKFLPGEAAEFHTRFTADATEDVRVGEDTFTWHIWNADGALVDTASCTTAEDSNPTTGAADGFDCVAPIVLPSDLGRYYTTLQSDRDGRWSCHNGQPIFDAGVESGVPACIKAFDVLTDTNTSGGTAPQLRPEDLMPFLGAGSATTPGTGWSFQRDALSRAERRNSSRLVAGATAAQAPSQVPEDPEITDATGDVTGAGLPIDHMDVEAAWFENDASFLYVGLKLTDIPADSTSTTQIAYHVNFKPDWVTDKTVFGVPAANTFNGLRVQGILSPLGFKGLTNPVINDAHHAELQHLSTTAAPASQSQFGTVADLELISVDPDTDIIWWAVPRDAIADPDPGDTASALSANVVPAVRGLVTAGAFYGDSSNPTDRTFAFSDDGGPLSAAAGGPYSGASNTPISISGAGSGGTPPYACQWTGPEGSSFADAGACATTVTFPADGSYTVDLTVTDGAGTQATATAPVAVASAAGERVALFLDGSPAGSAAISTGQANPSANWSVPVDMSDLSGAHTVTARWFDADDTLLGETSVDLIVEATGPEFAINITSPGDGDEVEPDFVVEGTTTGTASNGGAQRQGISQKQLSKLERGSLVVDRLPNLEKKTGHGPPVPEDSVGIGPGSTLISYFDDLVGICTAAFVYRDVDTGKVYLGAAGHCFMDAPFTSTHGSDADYDPARTTRVRVCVSTCIGGASGLATAAFGVYPSVTRDIGPLVYARQTLNAVDVGNDFGLVEIPPSLFSQIRTDMPVWHGPGTSENRAIRAGDVLSHYGNGIGVGEVVATKGRIAVGSGSNATRWIGMFASAQGDSGSAVNIATVGTDGIEGKWAGGVLTHLSAGVAAGIPYWTAGTTFARTIEMARQDAGIGLELIHDPSQLEASVPGAPSGLAASAGNGTVGLTWTAPSSGGAPIEHYTVKWGTTPGGPYPNTTTVAGTSTTVTGLTNGVTYNFVVSATNSEGEGAHSGEVAATPASTSTVPGAPGDLAAISGDGQVALSWTPPTDDGGEAITGYTVKWGATAGGPYQGSLAATDTSATVTGLTNGVTYFFVVSATNASGEGSNSNEVEATPEAPVSPFTVETRLGPSGEWVEVDAFDGSAWSKAFTDVARGDVTLEARLLEDGTEVARDSIDLVVNGTEVTSLGFTDDSAGAGQYSDDATLAARLTDESGDPISGAELVFELTGANGVERWTTTTEADGVGSITRALTGAPGTYNLTVNYAGTADYDPSGNQQFFEIQKEQTVTDLAATGTGSARTLTATASHDDPTALDNAEIVFSADGTEIGRATTNGEGVATLNPAAPYNKGAHDFEASFAGDDRFLGSNDVAATGEDATTLAFTSATASRGAHSDKVRVEVSLIDEAGDAVAGETVRFELTGPSGARSWTDSTDGSGVAGRMLTLSDMPGEYTLVARYDGRVGDFSGSTDDTLIVVEKEVTGLVLVVAGKGKDRVLTATLKEDDGPALAGQEVLFFANGTQIGRATTNASGVAKLNAPQGYRGDRFNFEARFSGTDAYRGSSGSYQT